LTCLFISDETLADRVPIRLSYIFLSVQKKDVSDFDFSPNSRLTCACQIGIYLGCVFEMGRGRKERRKNQFLHSSTLKQEKHTEVLCKYFQLI